jgi:P27 family predicted phage terminase small subunit
MANKKKPMQVKVLEGNRAKVAQKQLYAPEPQVFGPPKPPTRLKPDERRLWADVVRSLPVGLLGRADEGVIERYVVAWARFIDATAQIHRIGLMVQSPMGPIRNPLLVVQNVAAKEMHAAGSEIGLSPVARARMASPQNTADDPMALLLGPDGDPDGAWSTLPPGSRTQQ